LRRYLQCVCDLQILFATKRTTPRGRVARPTKVLAVAQSDSVGKQLRNGAAAGTLALSLLLNQGSALAITSDSAYVLTLQAKEAEQIELVKQGRASPVSKNPELSAVLSFVAVSTVAVAGVSYYFDNSPTNRLYRVQQDEENAKAAAAAEEEKK